MSEKKGWQALRDRLAEYEPKELVCGYLRHDGSCCAVGVILPDDVFAEALEVVDEGLEDVVTMRHYEAQPWGTAYPVTVFVATPYRDFFELLGVSAEQVHALIECNDNYHHIGYHRNVQEARYHHVMNFLDEKIEKEGDE